MMKHTQKQKQGGFTLIEIVMVIAILGILAAVAIPRFVDLSSDARTSAIQGAAGALSSYSAVNYAAAAARGTGGAGVVNLSSAATPAGLLTASMPGWDAAFGISSQAACGTASAGSSVGVTLTHTGGTTANSATATIICTG